MGMNRRDFLKLAGISALMGAGGKGAFELLAPGELEASTKALPKPPQKRWAMVVDVRKLDEEVMDKAIAACHRTHNVPDMGNPKHALFWLWKEDFEHAFAGQQHSYTSERIEHARFLLMCNHCSNPPCVRVCPTKATFQRADGLVMMDHHRCIGCRFCMAGCPFGVRSFNYSDPRQAPKELNPGFPANPDYPTRSKGVVEKCTFCAERLAQGLIPACVEAAPGALIFGDLADPESGVREALRANFTLRRKPELGTDPNVYYII